MEQEKLNINGKPWHPSRGLKRGPVVGNRKAPSRSAGEPLDGWMRHEFRTRAEKLHRGHETILRIINDEPGQSISRRTYFNALRGEPISERTRYYLQSFLKNETPIDPNEKSWEQILLGRGFSEDKARVFGEMLEAAAPRRD